MYGSKLYGTSLPTSDIDFKHVVLPDINDLLLGKSVQNRSVKTNNKDGVKNSSEDVDCDFIPIQVFARHFLDGQSYALELAFAIDGIDAGQEIFDSKFVEFVHELRDNFLTSNMTALIGYAVNQANIYSNKGERLNILYETETLYNSFDLDSCPDKHQDFFVLAEELQTKYPKYFRLTEYAVNKTGMMRPCVNLLESKLPTARTFRENLKTIRSKIEGYGDRAKATAENEVDFKAVSHAIRVIDEGIELLTKKSLTFPFDAGYCNYLLNIKTGNVSREEAFSEVNEKLEKVKNLEMTSTLPKITPQFFKNFEEWLASWMRKFYEIG
jgi:hypothetical protein